MTGAGVAAAPIGLPQPPQNSAAGSFSKPQFAHAEGSPAPQRAQKRLVAAFSAMQLGQRIFRTPEGANRSGSSIIESRWARARGIYDNMKRAVEAVFIGKDRQFNRRLLQMCGQYLIEPTACTPAGWEKGQVENQSMPRRRPGSETSANACSRRGCGGRAAPVLGPREARTRWTSGTPGCGATKASAPRRTRFWRRSTAGSPRGSTPPTSKRPRRCSTSLPDPRPPLA